MKKNCLSCKHWDPPIQLKLFPPSIYGECKLTEYEGLGDERERLAYAEDAERYHAILKTQASFSCCQWELRL